MLVLFITAVWLFSFLRWLLTKLWQPLLRNQCWNRCLSLLLFKLFIWNLSSSCFFSNIVIERLQKLLLFLTMFVFVFNKCICWFVIKFSFIVFYVSKCVNDFRWCLLFLLLALYILSFLQQPPIWSKINISWRGRRKRCSWLNRMSVFDTLFLLLNFILVVKLFNTFRCYNWILNFFNISIKIRCSWIIIYVVVIDKLLFFLFYNVYRCFQLRCFHIFIISICKISIF